MKAKHRILAAGMAAAMTLSLAACGGSASTAEPTASSAVEAAAPEATSEAAGGDVTEVTWWTYFGDKNIGYLQNIIDDFNNSQNQYHVTIVYQGNQMECNAKLQSTEKENLPAMFSGAVEDVAMYANSDFCVPLQKYVDADTEGWQELDDTWDALRSAYSDGQGNLIGYPIGYSYPNIFYNADLLKKAGVDPASIQSFDDLYDASKTIVDGGFATYGIGFFANGAMFNVALGREGVQAYNNENGLNGQPVTECLYDSDTTVHDSIYNMLSIYQKMGAEKLCVPYGADYQSEIIPQMASGDCAMMMGDHGQMDLSRVIKPNVFFADAGLIQVDENGNLRDWTAFCCSNAMSAMVYLKDPANVQDYAKTYAVLQKMAAEGIYGFTTVYTKDETKAMGLDGDFSFVLETDGYTSFSTDWNRPAVRPFDRNDFRYGHATHGYLPEKGPQPTFMAVGPSFRENVWLDSAAMIDEAPTFAALLGVPLPAADGKVLQELLR